MGALVAEDRFVLHLVRRSIRYWKTALVVGLLGAAGTAYMVVTVKRIFRSESVIVYRQTIRQDYSAGDSARRVGARLQDLLTARERLQNVVAEFGLFPDAASSEQAVELMKRRVGFRVREGATFVVSFDGTTPKEAQKVARRLTELLIEDSSRDRREEAEKSGRFLETEQQKLAKDVKDREEALRSFLKANPNLGAPDVQPPAGASNEIFSLEVQLARMKEARAKEADPAAAPSPTEPPADLVANVRRADAEVVRARAELATRMQSMTEANPDVVAAREVLKTAEARLAKARAELDAARPPAPDGRKAVATQASEEIALMERRLADLKKAAAAATSRRPRVPPQVELEFQTLRRALEEARDRLSDIERRRFQATLLAKVESSGEAGQLSVLDPANLPGIPFADTKRKYGLVGLGGTMLLMILAALARALTDDRMFDRVDVGWMLSQPVLASVPARDAKVRR